MNEGFAVYVFSFNRGLFLENCIRSIEAAADSIPIYIFDDNSTDPKTKEVLGTLSRRHRVIRNTNAEYCEMKTGGLSGSMNLAMSHALEEGFTIAVFIQDDMQFVRHIEEADKRMLVKYFDVVPNSIQIATSFVRRLSADTFLQDHAVNIEAGAYVRTKSAERGKSNFSDTGVFCVQRFHEIFKRFEVGEDVNSLKARSLSIVCGRAIFPFMCWLPYPQSHRGKKRTLRHRFYEYFGRSGYYPIRMMTQSEVDAFLSRDPSTIPVMEAFLDAPYSPRQDIWSTGGGEYNFLAYGGALAQGYSALRKMKRACLKSK